jgi:RNA polymerase sigma-70 factor (ECF subfamily)
VNDARGGDDDWELVQACVAGDARAWKRFLDGYARWTLHLIHHALKRSGKRFGASEAEDLLQDVLTYLVQNDFRELRKFPRGFGLKAWLRVVISGRCWSFLRKKRPVTLPELEASGASPAEAAPAGVPSETLETALQKLPWKDRLILSLFYFAGQSYDEIARSADVPAAQVGVLLARAREKLKESLGPML